MYIHGGGLLHVHLIAHVSGIVCVRVVLHVCFVGLKQQIVQVLSSQCCLRV